MNDTDETPIISLIHVRAEDCRGYHALHWRDSHWTGLVAKFPTAQEARDYAADLYWGLGLPGFYRGISGT